ncbi:hypothetical protein ACJMK2_004400 [Sinanodonta woodiana]|uniref:CARD domain-containing protein n=1 Tax=Sinanodonta woodiana TaxID=1069815 RepID=A0ABD3Y2E0_SINWO
MDDHHKEALRKNCKAICEDLEFDVELEINLEEQKLFTRSQLDDIKAANTQKGRIQRLLHKLEQRGPEAFDKFVISIQEHYSWLAEKLNKSYEEERNKAASQSSDRGMISVVDENPEQIVLKKVLLMLTDANTNYDSIDPVSVPSDVSLCMIETKVSTMFEKHKNLEKQIDDCYKALNISDKTKSLDVVVQDLADQNESCNNKIVRLRKDLRHKSLLIQKQDEQIQNLKCTIETIQEEKAQLQTKLQWKISKIKELSAKLQHRCSEVQASYEKINELNETILNQDSEIKVSREKLNELSEIIKDQSIQIEDSQAKLVQKKYPMKTTKEKSENIQIPNSKCEDLNVRSKHQMPIDSHHELSTFSTLSNIQRVPLERCRSVHDEVQDNNIRFPKIHHQQHISQQKKRSRLGQNSCSDGLANRGSSKKSLWKPWKHYQE